jgi:DNA-binding phage protein
MTTRDAMRAQLRIKPADVEAVNAVLAGEDNALVGGLLDLVEKYGGVAEINRKADEAGQLETRLARLQDEASPFLSGLHWLAEQRDAGAFVSLPEYRRSILGDAADGMAFNEANAVTLEVSALQYFPWLIAEAKQAIEKRELMPGRYIRVRNIAEQSAPGEDILAVATAMQIIGATHVETLDTKGIDGSNVHLGGPDTITGYFGGIGQPNDYPLKYADEYLGLLTKYGIRQALNINSGTILVALLMHKLGIRNEFKVSVFMGVDNAWSLLWLLMGARLLAADDGTTSMIGLNLSNSVDRPTLLAAAEVRRGLGFDDGVRLEHHVTETWKSIVRQPYDRRADVVAAAATVPNISAKHEGGDPEIEATREHPSDILDYFIPKEQVVADGLMPLMERNFLDKHDAVCHTAAELTRAGIGVHAAGLLHAPA